VDEIQVCENLGDHMVGNVYVKFEDEEAAEKSIQKLFGRYYAGRPLACEYSPVTDFREARCRQFDEGTCSRGGYCNFMHVREPSRELRKHLEKVWSASRVPTSHCFFRNLDFVVAKSEVLELWPP
jgi:splicing factor U2AF 35 kDa subunit